MKNSIFLMFALLYLAQQSVYALGGQSCATATVVGALPYSDGGQLDPPGAPNCAGGPVNDLFYVFTAPANGTYRFDLCGSDCVCGPLIIRLWTGGTCCSGASVSTSSGCVDGYPLYDLAMTSGQVVYIEVGKANPEWAVPPLYVLNVQLANFDVCPGIPIPALPYTNSRSTASATHQYNGICYTQSAPDVVYNYTSSDSVFVRASMVATWFDCMHVRKNNCATGASVQCDFGNGADSSWFDFWLEPDSTYYFIVDGAFNTDYGNYTFSLHDFSDICPGRVIRALPYTDSGSTQFATHQYSGSCYSGTGVDVVYQFTSPDSVLLTATLSASWNDRLQVRKNNCATGVSLQCDAGNGADSSWFVFLAEPDSIYYFIVDGQQGHSGPYTFTLLENPVQNDVCPGTVIPALPYTDNGSTTIATHQYSGSCNFGTAPDAVYNFTSPDSLFVRASMVATWMDCMYVLKNDCATGASLRCDYGIGADSSWFDFWLEPDSTYYFIADGRSSTEYGSYMFTVRDITPPANDLCPGTVIPTLPYTDSGSTTLATHQYVGSCYTQSARDVVYRYTSPDSVFLRAAMAASWFDCMHVRRNNCETGASLQCDFGNGPDSSWFNFWVEPDSTYYFILDGAYNSDFGPYTFTLQEVIAPPNDFCPGTVIPALPYTDSESTTFASHQYVGSCYTQSAPDLVYQFTSPDSVYLRAVMAATWFDCMHVRRNNCATGASLVCSGGSGSSNTLLEFWAEPDSTYYFIVDGWDNTDFGNYTFTLQDYSFDVCPGTAIPAVPYTDSGTTAPASHNYIGNCYDGEAPDVVYNYTSPDSILLVATVLGSWYNTLYVRKNDCATGASLLCDFGFDPDISGLVFWAEPDSVYYFIVDGYYYYSPYLGPYTFTLRESLANDICPGTVISALPYTDSGSTTNATHQYNGICYTQSAPDVVYRFTSPDSVFVRASMVAPWFDCMHVRRNNCEAGASLLCDFGNGPDSSWFDFWVEPDSTYFFFMDGAFNSDFGDYTFTLRDLSCSAPNSLVIKPSGANVVLTWPHVVCDTPLYRIYRNAVSNVAPTPANFIGTTSDTTYTDVGILSTGNITNFYIVTAE